MALQGVAQHLSGASQPSQTAASAVTAAPAVGVVIGGLGTEAIRLAGAVSQLSDGTPSSAVAACHSDTLTRTLATQLAAANGVAVGSVEGGWEAPSADHPSRQPPVLRVGPGLRSWLREEEGVAKAKSEAGQKLEGNQLPTTFRPLLLPPGGGRVAAAVVPGAVGAGVGCVEVLARSLAEVGGAMHMRACGGACAGMVAAASRCCAFPLTHLLHHAPMPPCNHATMHPCTPMRPQTQVAPLVVRHPPATAPPIIAPHSLTLMAAACESEELVAMNEVECDGMRNETGEGGMGGLGVWGRLRPAHTVQLPRALS